MLKTQSSGAWTAAFEGISPRAVDWESDERMGESLLRSPGHRLLIGFLLVASLVPVWTVEFFPSQNGPWSLLIAKMLGDYHDPVLNYSAFYEVKWHAIPHMLHTLVAYGLSSLMPAVVAHKVAISLFIVLFPISVFLFLEAIDPRKTVLGYASFLFVYNVPLLRGYHDYSIGLPLVLLTFAFWWRRRRKRLSLRSQLVIMAMTVPIYFSHIFNLCVLGLAMVLVTAWERRSAAAVGRVVGLFVIPMLFVAEYAWYTATHAEWVDRSERVFLTPPAAVAAFFSRFFYTLSYSAYVLKCVVLVPCALLVGAGLWDTWRRYKAGTLSAAAFALPVLLGVLTVCYFAMPYKFLNWHYANVRFVAYVLVFALACAAPPTTALRRRAFVAVLAAAALACHVLLTREFIRTNALIAEYVSGLHVVEMGKTMLPVSFSGDEIGEISPVAHAADYYQVFRGGANGWGMAQFNTLTPLVYRTYPVRNLFPRFERDPEASLEAVSRTYDYVLLWGDPGEATRRLDAAGFEVAHQQGRLRILRNRSRFAEETRPTGVGGPS